jgi:hypothetical protein
MDRTWQWFQILDGRLISSRDRTWIVRVNGIHVDGDDVWVQITRGNNASALLLHLGPHAEIADVTAALQAAPHHETRLDVARAA